MVNHMKLAGIVFLILPTLILTQSGTNVKDLITQLFTTAGYNKKVRPLVTDQSLPVTIVMSFYLSSIIDFDEQEESLTTSGYFSFYWTDEYLTWTPSSYGNLETLFLPQDDVWKPDISLRNTVKSFTGLGSSYLNLKVDSSGIVTWNPFQVLTSTCSIDITYFPFDTQTCNMKFTAWSYRKAEVELNLHANGVQLDTFSQSSTWELISTSAKEVNTDEAAVIFTLELKRKPLFYMLNVIAPVILLTFLNSVTFLIPITSGEKASYAITVFLALAVFLTIAASELPQNSDVVSHLGVYLMLMTCLSTLVVTIALIESRIAVREVQKHPINVFYRYLHKLANVLQCKSLCKKRVKPTESLKKSTNKIDQDALKRDVSTCFKDDIQMIDNTDDGKDDLDWMDIINAIDVVSFLFCFLFTFICTVVIGSIAVGYANKFQKQIVHDENAYY